jgi:hypothetical protein
LPEDKCGKADGQHRHKRLAKRCRTELGKYVPGAAGLPLGLNGREQREATNQQIDDALSDISSVSDPTFP